MGLENYWKQSIHNLEPVLDFISPVTDAATNFLTSGSSYDPNESATSNFTTSFTTPSNLFDDTFMSDNMDLTYGGGEVPELDGISSLPTIVIKKGPTISTSSSDRPYVSTPRSGTAVTERPWKDDEINVNAVGTHNSYNRGYDNVGDLLPGWELGLDDVPYNPALADSLINDSRSSGGGGGYSNSSGGSVPSAPVLRTRTFPFTSRTPSGTVYAPDLSAYNDSSLFNYAGPGGLSEYTYGQGLPTDGAAYNVWGSPADIANPYFSGQFATPTTPEPQGPADAAINMPAVELPEGVQPVSADVSMPGFTGSGNQIIGGSLPSGITPRPPSSAGDLTYQQTIDEMGIFGPNNPPPSTLFPSPGDSPTLTERMLQDAPLTGWPMDAQLQEADAAATQRRALADLLKFRAQDRSMAVNQELADLAMGDRLGFPATPVAGAPAMDDTADIERGMLTSQRGTTMDDTADVEAGISLMPTDMQGYLDDFEARGITDRTQQIMDYATQNNNMIDGVTIFDEGDPRQIFQDAILNPKPKREYKPVYGGIDGIPVELGPERSIWKDAEIDIPTPPFRPEGKEGEDYYQDVTGNYFAWHDDLGTEPLTGATEKQPLYQIPNRTYGTEQATEPSDYATFEGIKPRELTEAELTPDTGELTSGDMGALNDAMTAIDAKYAGSTTDASAEAELKEILNATLSAFGGNAGRENAALAREQQDMRQANATSYIPEYAREQEGTDMGESLFQNVAEDIPLSVFNPIDRVVMQAEAQAAQVAKAAAAKAAAEAEARRNPPKVTPANVVSIFSPPAGPHSMAQIKPMVAKTQNNMTVPKINWGGSGYGNNPGPWRW